MRKYLDWRRKAMNGSLAHIVGAIVNLDHPAHYIHWGWFQMSIANFVVVLLMVAVFVLAIVVPFPGARRR
jgi:uncharacterized membrane protein